MAASQTEPASVARMSASHLGGSAILYLKTTNSGQIAFRAMCVRCYPLLSGSIDIFFYAIQYEAFPQQGASSVRSAERCGVWHTHKGRRALQRKGSEHGGSSGRAIAARAADRETYEPPAMCNVTRRFANLPSLVALSPIGSSLPYPRAVIWLARPCSCRYRMTDSARACESFRL